MATNSAVGQGAVITGAGQVSIQNMNFNNSGQGGQQRQYSLREQLWFDEIKHRERVIDNAHKGTCTWLHECHQYRLWTAEPRKDWRHGLLWIKGNPGAGKSTIMKFAVDYARSQYRGELILPHFFNARGTQLEKSTEGMYRTLLVWLLDHLSTEVCEELRREFGMNNIGQNWPVPELLRILKCALEKIAPNQSTVFYIDALDECYQNEVYDMLKAFREIMEQAWETKQRIRICFASRPHPDTNFKDANFLDLSEQVEHIRDISRFINDELDIADSTLADDLRIRVREKAGGSFMWTRLVVLALNKEHHKGAVGKLHQRLDEIPSDLHELYYYTLESYPEDRSAMLICFQWLRFTKRSLNAERLWWAIQLGLKRSTEDIRNEFGFHSAVTMERYVVNVTKGLAEVRIGSCQFIHQSVADFLVAPQGLRTLFQAEDYGQFAAQSYELLKSCCEAELHAFGSRLDQLVAEQGLQDIPRESLEGDEVGELPFLLSAVFDMMHYADNAHHYGVDQDSFLTELRVRIGPYFVSGAEGHGWLTVSPNVYSFLLRSGCDSILSGIGSAPAHRAKELARSRGFSPLGTDVLDWLDCMDYVDLSDSRVANDIAAVTNLLLHHRDRSPGLQMLLSELRLASIRQIEESPGTLYQHDFLGATSRWPAFGLFLLLVCAPPETLEHHIERLRCWVGTTTGPTYLSSLKTMLFFIKNHLKSDLVDFTRPNFVNNVSILREGWGSEVQQASNQIMWLCATGQAS
ncbi:hypothetical protein CC79DRAFT_1363666 [Sarocladium strictum]